MATATKKRIAQQLQFGGVPYGNRVTLEFALVTNASGVWTDSDLTTAIQIADKLRLGILPAGLRLIDSLTLVNDAFTALTTMKLGFEYTDGVDSTGRAAGRRLLQRRPGDEHGRPLRGQQHRGAPGDAAQDAYLIGTWAGAANAVVGIADILIHGIVVGPN